MAGLAAFACATLMACAAADSGQPRAQDADPQADGASVLRVICVTTRDRLADDQLALDLARASGLAVQRLQAIGARTFAVTLACSPAERCQQGLASLRAAHPLVTDVSIDAVRARPRQPRAQEAR